VVVDTREANIFERQRPQPFREARMGVGRRHLASGDPVEQIAELLAVHACSPPGLWGF
jgi:hypothetical protein